MTLAEVIEATARRYALTQAERLTLTEAVSAYVEDGQLATLPDAPDLARKLGEVTMFRVAHRILETRLAEPHIPSQPLDAATETQRSGAAHIPERPMHEPVKARRQRACSLCHVLGHRITTCPRLRAS